MGVLHLLIVITNQSQSIKLLSKFCKTAISLLGLMKYNLIEKY